MKKNILCIDDIKTNLFILSSVIEDADEESYNVMIADSATKGLEILLKEKVDIILLDVMMPEINGFECAKMIKSNRKTQNIPIIFVTANNDDSTIQSCYDVGGDDYINKPFNHVELLSRISFHLNLQEKEQMLIEEKEYAQSILDLQENLVVITDSNKIIDSNKAMLDFFEVKKLQDFAKEYSCILKTFIQESGYFSENSIQDGENWVEAVIRLSSEDDLLVKIQKNSRVRIFTIKAIVFHQLYIITLTDITKMSELTSSYEHEANYDSLTQIYNRNMFHRLIDKKIFYSSEDGSNFVFIMIDIDFFKRVNDTYGHLIGDEVLINISKLVKKNIRSDDIFARWGGEEFVLVFNTNIDKGFEIADNLRKCIEKEKFEVVDKITCSFGITEFKQDDTLDTLIKRADDALYEAKETGRNKVCQKI